MSGLAVIYTRVSSEEQVGGTSLGTQEHACRDCAARLDLDVVAVFTDAGKSAKSTVGRDGLAAAVRECQKRSATLLVHKFDRLARNALDALTVRDALLARGCLIHSATEGAAAASPIGKAMFSLMSVFGELDNAMRAERSREGMRERARAGFWTFRAPVGYVLAHDAGGRPVLAQHETEAPILRSVFAGLADGSLSSVSAARTLREKLGIRRAHAYRVLRSPVYRGVVRNGLTDGEEVRAAFDGIVSAETWFAAQARLDARQLGKVHMKENPATPLVGVLVCAKCGKRLVGSVSTNSKKKGYGYYRCRDGHCSVSFEKANAAVRERLDVLQRCAPFLDLLRDRLDALVAVGDESEEAELKRARRTIATQEARLKRAREGFLDGVLDAGEYNAAKTAAQSELNIARTVVSTHERLAARKSDLVTALIDVVADPDALLRLPAPALRDAMHALFGALRVTPSKSVEHDTESVYQALAPLSESPSQMAPFWVALWNKVVDAGDSLLRADKALRAG